MIVIHSDQKIENHGTPKIFLAGPTPRDSDVKSWRPDAVGHLKALGFWGTVFVPERSDWTAQFDYLDQVEWEYEAIEASDVVAFWIPRDMATLIGLTTNVEMGYWLGKGTKSIVYGRPVDAPKTKYLDWIYKKHCNEAILETLDATMQVAVKSLN